MAGQSERSAALAPEEPEITFDSVPAAEQSPAGKAPTDNELEAALRVTEEAARRLIVEPDFSIQRPFKIEDERLLRNEELEAALCEIDLAVFTAQILTPCRPDLLHDLAVSIRRMADPYVRTNLPLDHTIRTERKSDWAPHKQTLFEIEMDYALWLLAHTESIEEKRRAYDQEANRLTLEVSKKVHGDKVKENPHGNIIFTLRQASKWFFIAFIQSVDWSKRVMMQESPPAAQEAVKKALFLYGGMRDALAHLDRMMPHELVVLQAILGNTKLAMLLELGFDKIEPILNEEERRALPGAKKRRKIEKVLDQLGPGGRYLLANVAMNQYTGMIPEIVFAMARCHALAGNHAEALKTLGQLELFHQRPECMPSPAIIESTKMLEEALGQATKGQPVVPDSPPLVLEKACMIPREFGGVPQRIIMPEDRGRFSLGDLIVPG